MRVLLIRLAIGVAAALVAAGAAAASALPGTLVAAPVFVPVAGPLVAGPEQVVWVRRRDDRVLDLWVAEPGRGARRVQRFSTADGERLRSPRLSASPAIVALELRVTDRRDRTLRRLYYSGPFGEPLTAGPGVAARPTAEPWPGHAVVVGRGCASAEIRTVATPEAGVPADEEPAPGCALRLRSPLRLHAGRLRLGVSCAGFRIDCTARVTVRSGRRVVARGVARYNHATPPYAAADLRVKPRDRRLLRPGRLVRVTARIGDAHAIDGRAAAGAVTRTRLARVQRATR